MYVLVMRPEGSGPLDVVVVGRARTRVGALLYRRYLTRATTLPSSAVQIERVV